MNVESSFAIDTSLNEITGELEYVDGVVECIVTPAWNIANDIKELLSTAKKLLISNQNFPFYVERSDITNSCSVGSTKLGQSVLHALKKDISAIYREFHIHRFHPILELFIRIANEEKAFDDAWAIASSFPNESTALVSSLSKFVERFRTFGKTGEFKTTIRNFERNSKENFLQFNRYIDAHFKNRSRLLFIRLDLGYGREYLTAVEGDKKIIYERIKSDWRKLHNDLNQKVLKENLLGFACKLEYGLQKSFHLHLLLILDSSALRSDITIAKIVGDHWARVVTKNNGLYFNCNAKKKSYRFCGIGQIHRDDRQGRTELRNRVGHYLTKSDYVVVLQTPDRGRTFSKGKMPA